MGRPNVLFFFTDDQRFDTIAALGNPQVKTPNMDELTRNGTTFRQAHIPGGTVGAVCMPSRAMLHTGRTLFHLEQDGAAIPSHHALLGETLRQNGYKTFGTGKWHNGTDSYARSFSDGAEIFFGGMWDHWNVPACNYDPTGRYEDVRQFIPNWSSSRRVTTARCDHVNPGKHSSELFCEAAINWLENLQDDAPFFMYLSFMAPHDPRSMPREFLDMYDPSKIELPDNYMNEYPFDFGVGHIRDELLAPYPRHADTVRQHIAEYYGMISHLDNELGKVIQALKKIGKYEDTIIVFAGDNGLALGQHGLFGKQSTYEHSVRVPLLFAGPGIPQNEQRDSYVYLMDIFPTLCDLLDISVPESVEGQSLYSAICARDVAVRDSLYFAYGDLVRSVKNQRYKLVEYRTEELRKTQLFDLQNDPYELTDLYGSPDVASIVESLQTEMYSYKAKWDDETHPSGRAFWNRYELTVGE